MHSLASAPTRRDHILMVASRIFGEVGYRRTTLQLIADEFGLTRPALYHYFPSKQAILQEIFERQMRVIDDALDEIAAEADGPMDFLRRYCTRHAEWMAANTIHGGVFWKEQGELPEARQADVDDWRRSVERRLRDEVRRAQVDGHLRSDVSDHFIVVGMLGMLNWMHRWYRIGGDRRPEEIGEAFWRMLAAGVAVEPGLDVQPTGVRELVGASG